jgi:hypothetical protein
VILGAIVNQAFAGYSQYEQAYLQDTSLGKVMVVEVRTSYKTEPKLGQTGDFFVKCSQILNDSIAGVQIIFFTELGRAETHYARLSDIRRYASGELDWVGFFSRWQ